MGRHVEISRADDRTTIVRLGGTWRLEDGLPTPAELDREIEKAAGTSRVRFEADRLESWDSSLVTFVVGLSEGCLGRGATVDSGGLPDGIRRLLALVAAVPEATAEPKSRPGWTARFGARAELGAESALGALSFLGESTVALGRLLLGRAKYRRSDLFHEVQSAGADALPIVTLIGLLLGMIMGFVGGVTLRDFGATLYVADLVSIAMVRELGAIMTAIVMAGRTGSAYAAEIGSMRVTQEIDALVTMGLPPTEFIVLNRLLALSLMLPFLCVYADFVGILGGGIVAVKILGLSFAQYEEEIRRSITLTTFWIGIVKSIVFGVLVAMCGCLSGLQAGRSAAAVGEAATRAVVRAIVWIIVADGLFAIVLYVLGI
jgi:phospholipid/cholesterol/gamma-HCH transport system permease protein